MKFLSRPFVLLLLFWVAIAIWVVGIESFIKAPEVVGIVAFLFIGYYAYYRFQRTKN